MVWPPTRWASPATSPTGLLPRRGPGARVRSAGPGAGRAGPGPHPPVPPAGDRGRAAVTWRPRGSDGGGDELVALSLTCWTAATRPPTAASPWFRPTDHRPARGALLHRPRGGGHRPLATRRSLALGVDGYGGGHHPDVLRALAGPGGWIGVLDAVLVARGTGVGGTTLRRTADHDEHHRVAYARETRVDVEVLGRRTGPRHPGTGPRRPHRARHRARRGRDRQRRGSGPAAATCWPSSRRRPVCASCSPGNARSLRSLLAVGFVPMGAEVLLRPSPTDCGTRRRLEQPLVSWRAWHAPPRC